MELMLQCINKTSLAFPDRSIYILMEKTPSNPHIKHKLKDQCYGIWARKILHAANFFVCVRQKNSQAYAFAYALSSSLIALCI